MALGGFDTGSVEYKLAQPPSDCIQSIKFSPHDTRLLLAASWDCSVRLYDVATNQLRAQYNHDAPVMDVAFEGSSHCWSGCTDNRIKRFDFRTQDETTVGYHSDVVRCVEYIHDLKLIATGSWDRSFKLWDPRCCDSSRTSPIANHSLPEKVYAMSVCGEKLIIGTSNRKVLIWDLRNMTSEKRETTLKYQIRCLEAFADQQGYVIGSIEGRVAVEYLDPSPEVQKQKYAFKCHRSREQSTNAEIIYPVNTLSFHKKYNTFATGGSDGFVSIWDGKSKKRLVQFHKYPTSISSLSFSSDGGNLAIACSYQHVDEEYDNLRDVPSDNIYIRRLNDNEVRCKS